MVLSVYNTLSRSIEEFQPHTEGKVGVYVCGMTVYDDMHIGHARTYLAFDTILRYLKYRGYELNYVQNVTDIDDKIINRAREVGADPQELADEFTKKTRKDQENLNIMPADKYPKVSGHIQDIITAVGELIEKDSAYESGGNVYFDVERFKDYGKLSGQDKEQLSQHRIEPDHRKKNSYDFSLWKKTREDELGFESPWGHGRPGWHIECSVMSRKYLGENFDIHGGALDLVFPHHENEVAQSETLTGKKPFVKYWMHTGFLFSSGEKMSKSLGNILPVREFLKNHGANTLRLFVLQTHYRSQIDYSEGQITAAEKSVGRLQTFRNTLTKSLEKGADGKDMRAKEVFEDVKVIFAECMDDDFNTPKAVAKIFEAVRELNPILEKPGESRDSLEKALALFDELTGVLGLKLEDGGVELDDDQLQLIKDREKYRAEKNWAKSDEIRDLLLGQGIHLEDKSDGTTIAKNAG